MSATVVSVLSGGHFDSITNLALSERFLASGSDDCTINLWSPTQSRSALNKITLEHPVTSIRFCENKPDLLFASHDGYVCSYDLRNTSSSLYNSKISEEEVNSIDLLECEARLAAGDDTGSIHIISSDDGRLIRTLKKHDNICSAVQFRVNKTWQVISGGLDSRLVVSDWKETGRGVTIFEMTELLDFPDEEEASEVDEEESDELEEVEEEFESNSSNMATAHRTSYSSNLSDGRNPWHTSSEPSQDEGEEEAETPPIPARHELDEEVQSSEEDENDESSSSRNSARPQHQVRIHTSRAEGDAFITSAMSTGLSGGTGVATPVNPPMIHSIASSKSGQLVAVGLASSSVELFLGSGKHLMHSESLYGHSRGVSTLRMLQDDQFLVSGGNDKSIFVWPLASVSSESETNSGVSGGSQVLHTHKVESITGFDLSRVYVSDSRTVIQMMDLSLC